MRKTKTIYARLFFPFSSILVIGTLIAWWLTTTLYTTVMEHRLESQILHATSILARGGIPYTESLLSRLGNLLKADIVLVKKNNKIGITTLSSSSPLVPKVQTLITEFSSKNINASVNINENGIPYILVYTPVTKPVRQQYSGVIALSNLNDLYQTSQQIAWWLASAAIFGILVFAILGHRAARSITQPVQALARMANEISAGNRAARASPQGSIELADLAKHLNHMANTLEKYETEVAESSRLAAIGQKAARIAHEIRNPLTAIKMQIELLSESLSGQDQEVTIKLMAEIRRLESIVSNTLGMSKTTALHKQQTDIQQLITEVTELFTAQFQHLKIQLQTDFSKKIALINIDPERIKQVLVNLVINASEAIQKDGTILIATNINTDKSVVTIHVDDSGPGIKGLKNNDVFSINTSLKASGFGLGLNICKELIELHGGRIEADQSPLGGARFVVDLPMENDNG